MGLRFVNFKLRNRKIQITHHVHKQNHNKNRKDRMKPTNTHVTPKSTLISRHFHHILKNLLKNPSTQTRPELTASTFANYRHTFSNEGGIVRKPTCCVGAIRSSHVLLLLSFLSSLVLPLPFFARRPQYIRFCFFLLSTLSFFDTIVDSAGESFSLHVCGQLFFFFFSALDLGGLLTLTIGVSPTSVLVRWCDVCPHSAVFRQGLTGNKAQSGLEECCS